MVTLAAEGSSARASPARCETGRAIAEAGLHPASGGDGTQLCSGDMLLEALAACAGVTLRAVATSLGIEVRVGPGPRRGGPRLPRHPGRRPRGAGRLLGDPPRLRPRHRRRRGGAGDAAEADRALLRRLPDARRLAASSRRRSRARPDGRARCDTSAIWPRRGRRKRASERDDGQALGELEARPAGAAGRARGRMARRLRLPAHLRGADALRRPLPLAGAASQTCCCAGRPCPTPPPSTASSTRRARSSASSSATPTSTTRSTRPAIARRFGCKAYGSDSLVTLMGLHGLAEQHGRGRALPDLRARARSRSASPPASTRSCCSASPSPTTATSPASTSTRSPPAPTAAARSGGSRSRSPGPASTTRAAPT